MIGSELYFSLFVGVVLSLIFAEKFGINPAGLVVPGYLALIFDQPIMLLSVLIISCLTYFIVSNGISKWVILYGRRKFAAIIPGMTTPIPETSTISNGVNGYKRSNINLITIPVSIMAANFLLPYKITHLLIP